MNYESKIRYAIQEAKMRNVKVIKLGIPEHIQQSIIGWMIESTEKSLPDKLPKLLEFNGIPVEEAETLQITTEMPFMKELLYL